MSQDSQVIKRICPQCGRVLEENWQSCPFCGKSFLVTQKTPASTGWGIASIVLGIISFVVLGIPLGIGAIICGSFAMSNGDRKGIAGIVLGAIGLIGAIVLLIMGLSLMGLGLTAPNLF